MEEWTKNCPRMCLAHCSTRAMGRHKMVGKEEILSLEQKIITLATHSLRTTIISHIPGYLGCDQLNFPSSTQYG